VRLVDLGEVGHDVVEEHMSIRAVELVVLLCVDDAFEHQNSHLHCFDNYLWLLIFEQAENVGEDVLKPNFK